MRHLVLVGLSGAGKSTIGKLLHKNLGLPLVDTDSMIERIQDRSVSEIFDTDGEAYFRDVETLFLKQLKLDTPTIIATGGGMVLRKENRDMLRKLGVVVWLNTSPEDIIRVIKADASRPLLEGQDKFAKLKALLSQRSGCYDEVAHHEIVTLGMSEIDVAEKVSRIF